MFMKKRDSLFLIALFAASAALAAGRLVECESFRDLGGWTVDPHSMRQIGSSYVMAHGCGAPVADAVTEVSFDKSGAYTVWARTRNWNALWTGGAAGRFRVSVGGHELPEDLGTGNPEWMWVRAGEVEITANRPVEIRLHDLTGFNGRCDALWFSDDATARPPDDAAELTEWRRKVSGMRTCDAGETWDFIVVGGGVAGICAAQTAARYGVKTLLLQDRPVLGGCNSSEIRVSAGGMMQTGPYPALGRVLAEILPVRGDWSPLPAKCYEDERKSLAFEQMGLPLEARVRQSVYALELASDGSISAVLARDTHTGAETRYRAGLFADATGDGTLARLAGCATMYGRESRADYGEPSAPVQADRQVMGHSVQWTTRLDRRERPFPDIDWGLPVSEETGNYATGGSWEQEAGQYRDMADETEIIRDYGLLAIFSNWSFVKNRSKRRAEWRDRFIDWISPVGGKRESHRVVGDYVLTQNDLERQRTFEDGTAVVTWDIDLHFPDPANEKAFKEPFRSCAYHRGFGDPVAVPYRCLYARDCPNLFLAGRDISCTHAAFAAVRVMKTLGMLGEVVGMAAGICKEKGCRPRAVYSDHLALLKTRMTAGAPARPQYCAFSGGLVEKYHFKDLGFVTLGPERTTNLSVRVKEAVGSLKLVHRYAHPELAAWEMRRLVLADESRGYLHFRNAEDSGENFSVKVSKPAWDLRSLGGGRYRTVCPKGFEIVDMKERRIAERFTDDRLEGVSAVCDLPDGGFLAAVNSPLTPRQIDVQVYSPARVYLRRTVFPGIYNARTMERLPSGEILLTHDNGAVRARLAEEDGGAGDVTLVFKQPRSRNMYHVIADPAGDGYWAGTGYGAELVHYDSRGEITETFSAKMPDGLRNFFYAQVGFTPSGNITVCNWTGHGAGDSSRGWQVLVFDRKGKLVWHLFDSEKYGSIHGLVVVD